VLIVQVENLLCIIFPEISICASFFIVMALPINVQQSCEKKTRWK